jgi:hypothetical protein
MSRENTTLSQTPLPSQASEIDDTVQDIPTVQKSAELSDSMRKNLMRFSFLLATGLLKRTAKRHRFVAVGTRFVVGLSNHYLPWGWKGTPVLSCLNGKMVIPKLLRQGVVTWCHESLCQPGESRTELTIKQL